MQLLPSVYNSKGKSERGVKREKRGVKKEKESPFLEIFKTRLDKVLCSLL